MDQVTHCLVLTIDKSRFARYLFSFEAVYVSDCYLSVYVGNAVDAAFND